MSVFPNVSSGSGGIQWAFAGVVVLLLVLLGEQAAHSDDAGMSVVAVLVDDDALNRPHDVEIQGNLAFVPGKGGSIAIIDIAKPVSPRLLWYKRDRQELADAETVLTMGSYLLLGTKNALISFDISDPSAPRISETVRDPKRIVSINGMVKRKKHIFAACKGGWVDVFSVADPAAPKLVGAFKLRTSGPSPLHDSHDIDLFGDYILVVDPGGFGRQGLTGKLGVYRIADPSTHELLPVEEWKQAGVLVSDDLAGANRLQVQGNYAYVGRSLGGNPCSAAIVDISKPERPIQVASVPLSDPRGCNGLTVVGKVLFLAGGQTVEAIDISTPTQPAKLTVYKCLDAFAAGQDSAHDLVYRNGYLYVTGQRDNSFVVLRVNSRGIRELTERENQ